MTLINAHFVVFLQIYDTLSPFSKLKIHDLKKSRHCFSWLNDKVKLLLKSDKRQVVIFIETVVVYLAVMCKGIESDYGE